MILSKWRFFFYIIGVVLFLFFSFKIFHYYYKGNYCNIFSDTVLYKSSDEMKEMKKCINIPVCEIGKIKIYNETGMKEFICIRKIKPGVWKQ